MAREEHKQARAGDSGEHRAIERHEKRGLSASLPGGQYVKVSETNDE